MLKTERGKGHHDRFEARKEMQSRSKRARRQESKEASMVDGIGYSDQWTLDNETLEEVLRKIYLFQSFAVEPKFGAKMNERSKKSARDLKDGLYDRMVAEGVDEVRTGKYVAQLVTGFGGGLSLRDSEPEVGL